MKVKTLKEVILVGKRHPPGVVLDIDDKREPGLALRWIDLGYAEATDKPKPPPSPPVETASVETGERAVEPKPKPKRKFR